MLATAAADLIFLMKMKIPKASNDAVRPITDPTPMYLKLLVELSSAANDDWFYCIQRPWFRSYPSWHTHVLLISLALSTHDWQTLLLSHFTHALISQDTQANALFRVRLFPHVSHMSEDEQSRQLETLQEIQELFNSCLPFAQRLHLLSSPQKRQSWIEQARQRLPKSEYPVAHAKQLLVERHSAQ